MTIQNRIDSINNEILRKITGNYTCLSYGLCDKVVDQQNNTRFREYNNKNSKPFLSDSYYLSFFHVIEGSDYTSVKALGSGKKYTVEYNIKLVLSSLDCELLDFFIFSLASIDKVVIKSEDRKNSSVKDYLGTDKINYDKLYYSIIDYSYTMNVTPSCKEYCIQ